MNALLQPDLSKENCRDALKTLNELGHNQEIRDQMIDHDLLQIASNLLKHVDAEVRE